MPQTTILGNCLAVSLLTAVKVVHESPIYIDALTGVDSEEVKYMEYSHCIGQSLLKIGSRLHRPWLIAKFTAKYKHHNTNQSTESIYL